MCESYGDEDATYTMQYTGMAPAAGLTPAKTRWCAERNRKSYGLLLRHIDDEGLKATLRAEALRDGRQAWIVMLRECSEDTSTLNVNTKILEWHQLDIAKDIGYGEGSLIDFNRLLTKKREELPPNTFSDDQVVEKFLGAIKVPSTLASKAEALLQCAPASREDRFYTQAVVGPPAVPAGWLRGGTVQIFDELWRAAFKRVWVTDAAGW